MDQINEGLDRIAAILSLAFEEQLLSARAKLREDPTTAAILDSTEEWAHTTALQQAVSAKTGVSARTVRGRLAELKDRKILLSDGSGNSIRYKSSGIV